MNLTLYLFGLALYTVIALNINHPLTLNVYIGGLAVYTILEIVYLITADHFFSDAH